jgi:hypothetical protein
MSRLEHLQIWALVPNLDLHCGFPPTSPTLLSLQLLWTVEGLLESKDHYNGVLVGSVVLPLLLLGSCHITAVHPVVVVVVVYGVSGWSSVASLLKR